MAKTAKKYVYLKWTEDIKIILLKEYHEKLIDNPDLQADAVWTLVREALVRRYPENSIQKIGVLRTKYAEMKKKCPENSAEIETLLQKIISNNKPSCLSFLDGVTTEQWRITLDFVAAVVGAGSIVVQVGLPIPDYGSYLIVSVALIIGLIAKLSQYHDGTRPLLSRVIMTQKEPALSNVFYMNKDYKHSVWLTSLSYIAAILINLYALGAFGDPDGIGAYVAVAFTSFLIGFEGHFHSVLSMFVLFPENNTETPAENGTDALR